MDFVTQAGPLRELVEGELAKLFTPEGLLTDADVPPGLAEPMRYALLGGGKRLRPVLCLAACQAVCGDPAPALPAALAIEVLHNYTLVHDDLPCMDDDAMRRGRPTVHAKYGYAQAVLVGDALQAAAFELALLAPPGCARILARAAGPAGVVGGQWVDVTSSPPHDAARVSYVHAHKTGDLIACACEMGAVAGITARGGSGDPSPDRLPTADPEERKILDALARCGALPPDAVVNETGLPAHRVGPLLIALEMKSLVRRAPDGSCSLRRR